jgi:replication-associated recombination protein RarA
MTQGHFVSMTAITSGVADVKKTAQEAKMRLKSTSTKTYLFLDEM